MRPGYLIAYVAHQIQADGFKIYRPRRGGGVEILEGEALRKYLRRVIEKAAENAENNT